MTFASRTQFRLVGAFSVITNLRICFGWNFLKHYKAVVTGRCVPPVGYEGHEVDPGPDLVSLVAGLAAGRPLRPLRHRALGVFLNTTRLPYK